MQLYLAVLNHKPVSGVIFLYYGDQAVYGYGASTNDRSIWPLGVNQLVMWEAIKDAYQRGYRWVDFGRTPQSHTSLLAYKEKWGAVSSPLEYSYYGSRTSPSQRENTVVKIASRFLQLMPYPLFKHISPTILKNAI
jgi:lipid II:glycine glycyltransferase (peptidoglycan interpeptide bridge formation enzyme)